MMDKKRQEKIEWVKLIADTISSKITQDNWKVTLSLVTGHSAGYNDIPDDDYDLEFTANKDNIWCVSNNIMDLLKDVGFKVPTDEPLDVYFMRYFNSPITYEVEGIKDIAEDWVEMRNLIKLRIYENLHKMKIKPN
jgi:hypothetical protein